MSPPPCSALPRGCCRTLRSRVAGAGRVVKASRPSPPRGSPAWGTPRPDDTTRSRPARVRAHEPESRAERTGMTSTDDRIGGARRWDNLHRPDSYATGNNVGRRERWISAVAAAAVAAYGLRRRRGRAVLLPIAGSLLGRAVSGRCPVNQLLGRNSAVDDEPSSPVTSVRRGEGVRVNERIVINRARDE